MKTKYLFVVSFTTFITGASAENYIVGCGESLSTIIQRKFPNDRIYGKKGMLKKVLALNPKIKNPDHVLFYNKIVLPDGPPVLETQITQTQVVQKNESPVFKISSPLKRKRIPSNDTNRAQIDRFTLKALYGVSLMSLDQSQTLTGYSMASLATNFLKVETEFDYDSYKLFANVDSYSFSYASANASHADKITSFELGGVYKNFLLGFSYEEIPLIKATTTSLDMTKEGTLGIMLGYDKTWKLPTNKLTEITSRSTFVLPFQNASDKVDVTFKSISGFELKTNLEISRALVTSENYGLSFLWQNELSYAKSSRTISWGSSSGKVELTKIEAKSLLGLGVSF